LILALGVTLVVGIDFGLLPLVGLGCAFGLLALIGCGFGLLTFGVGLPDLALVGHGLVVGLVFVWPRFGDGYKKKMQLVKLRDC
jgi:hypothetical protein